jgi:hypothetical protein
MCTILSKIFRILVLKPKSLRDYPCLNNILRVANYTYMCHNNIIIRLFQDAQCGIIISIEVEFTKNSVIKKILTQWHSGL